jgi:hypothetical protein
MARALGWWLAMARRRGMRIGIVAVAVLIVAGSFGVTLVVLDALWPSATVRPVVVGAMAPLPAVSRTSVVIAPTAIALTAIREAVDRKAPRNLAGKRDNPLSNALGKADIGWTLTRGPLSVVGSPEAIAFSTPLNGVLRTTGALADGAGSATGKLTSALSASLGRDVQGLTGRTLDQRADLRGTVTMTSRPILSPNWRIEPNLMAQVAVGDTSVSIAGVRVRVGSEIKPLIDKAVGEQVAALEARLRADPFVEAAARREWAKMCRSVSLKSAAKDAPDLWMEMRPIRAFAAQPRIEAQALVVTLGVEAETRVVPVQTTPNCPFPRELAIVPPLEDGRIAVAVPIDMPFTEVNRIVAGQLIGRDFSAPGAAVAATVLDAQVTPAGDRLLISLRIKAREQTSWFGLGAEASVNVWGRPVLDPAMQTLRLADIVLDVDSQAAFGLLGTAARAAIPYLQAAIEENAKVDLAPFAADARRAIEASLADFRRSTAGVEVEAGITGVRLAAIAFDAKTLRVVAEAEGTAKVAITSLAP